jgi:adenylate cyclase
MMALFGAPLQQPDHAARAVAAAIDMGRAVDELNRQLAARRQPTIDFGIGINTAAVVVGNMGSRRRLNYTAIGDGVNLAARVEKLTREYDVRVIVTASTQAEAPGFLFREIDRVRVRGREEPVRIFEPLGEMAAFPEESLHRLDNWHAALKRYRSRDWAGAESILAQLQDGEQHSQLYALYRQRIETLRLAPPPAAWDGTFSQHSL